MTSSRNVVAAACVLLVAASVPAQPAATPMPKPEPVLSHLPAGALGFAVIPGAQATAEKVDKFLYEFFHWRASALAPFTGGLVSAMVVSEQHEGVEIMGLKLDSIIDLPLPSPAFALVGDTLIISPVRSALKEAVSAMHGNVPRLTKATLAGTGTVQPDPVELIHLNLEGWEKAHGRIPDRAIVLIRTGWGSRWPDRKAFLGTDLTGPEAVPELHFPGISPDAAKWIVDERRIDAIGIDTPSIDYGQSKTFETHQILYGANIPGFENLAHLDELPESGSFVVALPMKIAGGSGGPLRMVGFVPY